MLAGSLFAAVMVLASPDGRLSAKFETDSSGMRWSLSRDGETLVSPSSLGIAFANAKPLAEMKVTAERRRSSDVTWTANHTRRSTMRDRYNELAVDLVETEPRAVRIGLGQTKVVNLPRRLGLVFRAYDEGVAFRYTVPEQGAFAGFEVKDELTEWCFAADTEAWTTLYDNECNSQEGEFKRGRLADISPKKFVGMPVLARVGKTSVALFEADLVDWSGFNFVVKKGPSGEAVLASRLVRLPATTAATPNVAVIRSTPAQSPWRVALVGDDEVDLLRKNDLSLNLCPPPDGTIDFSFVRPGASSWDWWVESNNSLSTELTLKLVDFAAEMGWPYHTIDGGWYGFARRPNHGPGIKLEPRKDFDLKRIIAHAKEKGVGIWVWIHWMQIRDTGLEETFSRLEKWGVKGVKTDFLDRQDQEIVNWCEDVCRVAAKHRIMMNFHGSFKPTGRERTWPNMISREAVRGNEMNIFASTITPAHCATLPFTRFLLGPADFTPGSFGNVFSKDFTPQCKKGHRYGDETDRCPHWAEEMGTRAHSIAQCVQFDSPIMTLCDWPERYRGAPGIEALRKLPSSWKNTVPVAGRCGEFYDVLRETSDGRFYFSATTVKARRASLRLDFLGAGEWTMRSFADDPARTPADAKAIACATRAVKPGETVTFDLCDEGGAVAIFEKADAWAGSEWLSVPNAPVAGKKEADEARAADGTSWFVGKVKNPADVARATWTVAGLGVFEAYVNGKRVGNDFLKPGFTQPNKTKISFSYDVTDMLKRGTGDENTLAAEVSSGWWRDKIISYRGRKSAFRGVLSVEYSDGTRRSFGTNVRDWTCAVGGPVTHAGIYDGEEFDARIPAPFFGGEGFGAPEVNAEFRGEIVPTPGAEVTVREDLAFRPVTPAPKVLRKGETVVLDFSQNCSAVPRFRFRSKKGATLTALPAETVNDSGDPARGNDGPKGSVYRANLRRAETCMRLVYTFGSDGWESYQPRFTFFGYRYIAISATDDVEIAEVLSVPVSSISRAMETGRIETGDPAVNRLIANSYWGQLSNYLSVPTDCPQRNERQGWTADTQVYTEAGAFNADTSRFFHKWMRDVRDTIGPTGSPTVVAPGIWPQYYRIGWTDAMVIVPYLVWRQFGDTRIVEENFDAIARYMNRLAETQYRFQPLSGECHHGQYADWLSFEKYEQWVEWFKWSESKRKGRRPITAGEENYFDYLGGCYWVMTADMTAAMAEATGRDAAAWRKMAADARAYMKGRFFASPDGMVIPDLRDMQAPALFALRCGLVEGAARDRTVAALRKNFESCGTLRTGFLGTSIILDTLTANGMADIAWNLLLSHKFPGWLYSVDQGATTIWERWNGYTKEKGFGPVSMNSFNHYAYGAVSAWIYKTVAGIASDERAPGFRNIVMAPIPDRRLGHVTAEYRSAAGLVKSAWRYEGDVWTWTFTIPQGATASVMAPGGSDFKTYAAGSYTITRTLK